MELGIIGLGRMGAGIARRLTRAGHSIVGYDRSAEAVAALAALGPRGAADLADLVRQLTPPRAVWLMLPAGAPTEDTLAALVSLLGPGDVVVDGGNSYYRDDIRRAKALAERGVLYLDAGVSGGVWGLERGFCTMTGGDRAAFDRLEPIFAALAPGLGTIARTPRPTAAAPSAELGYIHTGPAGSGHFVKMIHNGIEYALMQAYAEGFDILHNKNSPALREDERYDLNTADIAEVWRRGSVITSWLLDLTAQALAKDAALAAFTGAVPDSGEGRWTLEAAIEEAVPAPAVAAALFARFRSRAGNTFGEKLLSALRFGFGGHVEPKS